MSKLPTKHPFPEGTHVQVLPHIDTSYAGWVGVVVAYAKTHTSGLYLVRFPTRELGIEWEHCVAIRPKKLEIKSTVEVANINSTSKGGVKQNDATREAV